MNGPVGDDATLIAIYKDKWWTFNEIMKQQLREDLEDSINSREYRKQQYEKTK